MKFSRFAGVSIIPVLARIVLGATFIPVGLHKVVHTKVFEGEAARVLTELQVGEPAASAAANMVDMVDMVDVRTVALMQEQPAAAEDAPVEAKPASESPVAPPPDARPMVPAADAEPAAPAAAPPVSAKAVHGVTVLLVNGGWPMDWKPHWMAWLAGLTELLGGVLILLGLFGRIWGLGLAIAMGFAFYLTSMHGVVSPGLFKMAAGEDGYAAFNRLTAQSSLFVLAFGVLLTGPGPLSLDRLLFRRRGAKNPPPLEAGPSSPVPSVAPAPAPAPEPAPKPRPTPVPSGEPDGDERPSSGVRPL